MAVLVVEDGVRGSIDLLRRRQSHHAGAIGAHNECDTFLARQAEEQEGLSRPEMALEGIEAVGVGERDRRRGLGIPLDAGHDAPDLPPRLLPPLAGGPCGPAIAAANRPSVCRKRLPLGVTRGGKVLEKDRRDHCLFQGTPETEALSQGACAPLLEKPGETLHLSPAQCRAATGVEQLRQEFAGTRTFTLGESCR
jgi:hypothetical protein